MYNHILISTDGSEVAQKGVDHGLSLAKSLNAKVTIVTVTEPLPIYFGAAGADWTPSSFELKEYQTTQKQSADQILAAAKKAADRLGVAVETRHVPNARPAEAILETATANGCSLIAMASHGRRGLHRLLLGSQTSEVLAHSPVPVLVIP